MATHKVPSNYFFVDDIPRSATGKIQRIDMHRRFADRLNKPYVPPRNQVERILETLFRAVLCCGPIGIDDNFFNLGGDSLLAMALFLRLDEAFTQKMPMATIFRAATIRQLARIYGEPVPARPATGALVCITPQGSMPPVFAMPGIYGNVVCFADLARELGSEQPFYGLQSIGLDGSEAPLETIAEIAARNIEELRVVQPRGPYYLLGACFGATVTFEMARQLIAAGEQVAFCGLLDPSLRGGMQASESIVRLPRFLRRFVDFGRFLSARVRLYGSDLRTLSFRERVQYIRKKLQVAAEIVHTGDMLHGNAREFNQTRVYQANLNALLHHQPTPIPAGIAAYEIFRTQRRIEQTTTDTSVDWDHLAGQAACHTMPGKDSGDMLQREHARTLARILEERLKKARAFYY